MQLGNLDAARIWIMRGIAVAREAEDDYGLVGAQYTLGWLELLSGAGDHAKSRFASALDIIVEGDLLSIADQVQGIAAAEVAAGSAKDALTLFAAADRMLEEVETALGLPWTIWVDPAIAAARAGLSDKEAAAAWEAGRAMTSKQVLALVRQVGVASGGTKASAEKAAGGLSRRELEVAKLVAAGSTNRDIAGRLFLSDRTVESHIDHILSKLGFNSRAQVAAWVAAQRLEYEED
jgi:DNA-binding NarL/FixJ family response regulator